MTDSKKLYFIPIIARAIASEDPKKAMDEAFNEIQELGRLQEYKEGFHQFQEFVKTAIIPSDEGADPRNQLVRNAIHRLIYDLVTDTFDGDEDQKSILITAIKGNPEWNIEYERIKEEAKDFLAPDVSIEVEILKGDQMIGSILKGSDSIGPISPGKYTFRFSNGRILWEGDITREDVIWMYAFPGRDLLMAAETDPLDQEPTRVIPLLDGELIVYVYAGLESGRIGINGGQNT